MTGTVVLITRFYKNLEKFGYAQKGVGLSELGRLEYRL